MKVYDSVLFFNELDLLELRMETLDPFVDHFIVSECDSTFSGLDKPFYLEENKEKFRKFAHKIIHIKNYNSKDHTILKNVHHGEKGKMYNSIIDFYRTIENTAQTANGAPHWCRDFLHREYTKLGMADCDDTDIIMFSDTDEIPSPNFLASIKDLDMNHHYCLLQDNNNYYINNISSTNWRGNIICNFRFVKDQSLNLLRIDARARTTVHNFTQEEGLESCKFVEDGGWHFSFMGGAENIKEKIQSYGHQEFNNDSIINNIESNINNNKDLFNRNNRTYNSNTEKFYFESMKVVPLEEYLPPSMCSLIRGKFPYLIKE